MARALHILIAEDNPSDAELVLRELRKAGYAPEAHRVETEVDYIAHLRAPLDVIISDFAMPQFSGLRALELLNQYGLDVPFIIVSGTIGEDAAVTAMQKGAADYLPKDRLGRLGAAVERAMKEAQMRRDRQTAEAALRESEERFRQLAENIQDVFWLTDLTKNQMLYVSPAYETIWGRSCADLYTSPRAWLDAIHPDDRERVFQSALTKQPEGIYDEKYRIIRPDGTVRWIRDRAFPVVSAAGQVNRVAGVARDITEGMRAEEELRESDRRFREMLENVELIAMTLDTTGVVTFCNDCLLKITGYTRAEVIGTDWFERFVPEETEVRAMFFETIESGEIPSHYENPIRTKSDQLRDIVWNNTVLRDGEGKIIGVASIGTDVTEQKRAEERVREQAAMLDRARDAIIVRGFYDRKISFWSKGAESLYGWTVLEAIGRDIGELLCSDPGGPDEIRDELLTSDEWRGETQHRTKGGQELIVNTRATLVRDLLGEPKSVLSINTDVTEQKALEARFLRAQRMESIGTLASGVAHDLNNILAPIMMSAPLLRQDLPAATRDEIVSTIEISAERGAQIVKQVLTFGRGLGGEKRPLEVRTLINELIKIIRETFPKDITVESTTEPDMWPVIGDATQLQQVLLNLCVNARDAMPNGGLLRFHAGNLDLDASYASMLPEVARGPHILLEVSDTGSGIPPEIVERIFDPFFTTKGIGKGTGLGLSTVLGIVKGHGGTVHVKTRTGQGSTFQVYLPALPARTAPVAEVARPSLPRGDGELVLIVDDEPGIRTAVRNALENYGYRVLAVANGVEGLVEYGKSAGGIAVVLTDMMMPVMDGLTFIRALRALSPELPIIASTGLGEQMHVAELKAMNVENLLTKPFAGATLIRAVYDAVHPRAGAADS